MAALKRDILTAARSLVKSPGFTVVAVITLALGIGINTTVFSLINGVLLRPFPFPRPDRLVFLDEIDLERGDANSVSYPDFVDWKQQSRSFESLGALQVSNYNLAGGEQPERLEGAAVSDGLFQTVGVPPQLGRGLQAEDFKPGAPPTVLLSHALWQRRFNSDPQIVGKPVQLDNEIRSVVGVMPPGFKFPLQTELWVPLPPSAVQKDRKSHFLLVLGRLKDGVSLSQAQSEIAEIAKRLQQEYPDTNKAVGSRIMMLREYFVRNVRPVLLVLLAAVGFVLLIVCANLANLILTRGLRRQRDVAIRLAMGAQRSQLIQLLLMESFVLTFLGALLGLLLAHWGVAVLASSLTVELPYWLTFDIDGRVLAFTVVVALIAGFLAGVFPALRLSKTELSSALREGGASIGGGVRQRRLSNVMVVIEITLSLVLLLCATLMVRGFVQLQQLDPGFSTKGVLTAQISDLPRSKYPEPAQVAAFYREVVERAAASPGVDAVAVALKAPLASGGFERSFTLRETPADSAEKLPLTNYQVISPGYFKTLGVPLLKGRTFTPQDGPAAPGVVIVNHRMADHLWPNKSPLGQQIALANDTAPWRTVVGVVGDTRSRGLGRELTFDTYVPLEQAPERAMTLLVRGGGTASLAGTVRQAVASVDPNQPIFSVKTLEQVSAESLTLQRFTTQLIVIMGLLALILAGVGLYGVIAYAVSQQTHEIGLRMALGAQTTDILRMVVRKGVVLGLIGVGIGLPLSLGANRLLASVVYGVSQTEILTIAGISALFLALAALASFIPARRATHVDPLVALRQL